MNSMKTLTAREAYHDCLLFFENTIKPSLRVANAQSGLGVAFTGKLDPLSEFEVKVTVTHAALIAFVKRYPAAEFTFHAERKRLPGLSQAQVVADPLNTQYVEFTLNFTPYGTIFGGASDDDGGNGTHAYWEDDENATEEEEALTIPEPLTAPTGPSGPMGESPSGLTPSTA